MPLGRPYKIKEDFTVFGLSGHSGRRTKALYLKKVLEEKEVSLSLKTINRQMKWKQGTTVFERYSNDYELHDFDQLFPLGKMAYEYRYIGKKNSAVAS